RASSRGRLRRRRREAVRRRRAGGPARRSDRAQAPRAGRRGGRMTRTRILVVDDRDENRRLVVKALEPLEVGVDEAADAEDALKTARARPPDVVVLDVQLPGRDGYEVCGELKADPRTRDAPVVLLTAVR